MVIKQGDFVEIDYTGRVADEDIIFDTTIPSDAKKAGLIHEHAPGEDHGHHHNHLHEKDFKPVVICVGQKHLLPGLDKKLEGLDVGKHEIKLSEDEAFGKKDSKLLKLIPLNVFKEQKVNPYVGMVLNIDNSQGVIRSISGGRVIVDFNHPLAGKSVVYSIEVKKKVDDAEQKVKALLTMARLPFSDLKVEGDKASAKLGFEIPAELLEPYLQDVKKLSGVELKLEVPKQNSSANKKSEAPKAAAKESSDEKKSVDDKEQKSE